MDLAELLARLADLGSLTDEELVQLDADLAEAAEQRAEPANDDQLAELLRIAEATQQVRAEAATREEASAARAEQARVALEAIRGEPTDDGGDDATADEAEPEPAAEPEPVAEETPATEPVPEPVAASVPAVRPRLGRVGARRDARTAPVRQPTPARSFQSLGLVASANNGRFTAGEPIQDQEKLADLIHDALNASAGYTGNDRLKVPLVTMGHRDDPERIYGTERFLDGNTRENQRKIAALTTPEAILAAGGICAPPEVDYTVPVWGSTSRPVWDRMLARFGARRGAITSMLPPTIEEVDGAVGQWTMDTDEVPGENVKPCLTVTCPSDNTDEVYAVTECFRYGNFRRQYFAEQIDAWLNLIGVWHARFAERLLINRIGTDSTQVTTGTVLGTTRDVMAALDRATAAMMSRHRLENVNLTFGVPFWLRNMMRTDLARELPGAPSERLAVSDSQIAAMFAARGVTPTYMLDGETGQEFGSQGDGPLIGWPSTVISYLYPTGSWLGLDGGRFDFGLIRDKSLIETNEVLQFTESMEGLHFHGVESWRIAMDVCPDGSTSSTVEIDPCSTGS